MKKGVMFEAVVTLLLLLLIFVMYVMIAGNAPQAVNGWNVTIGGQAPYLYAGDNGTLYVFSGNNVSMIDAAGALKWNVAIPDNWTMVNEWTLYNIQYPTSIFYMSQLSRYSMYPSIALGNTQSGFRSESTPAVASENGILYVYIRPDFFFGDNKIDGNISLGLERALGPDWNSSPSYVRLMAISPDGSILWNKPIDNGTDKAIFNWMPIEDVFISATSDRIYVYHPYSVTVLDTSGTFLFRLDNVSDPAAVDEQGNIYTVNAVTSAWNYGKVPSSTLVAYDPNGALWWQRNMSGPVQR